MSDGRNPTGPELLALLEVFATVDTVFSEFGAFGTGSDPSLGRIYNSWKKARRMLNNPVCEPFVDLGPESPVTDGPHSGTRTPVRSQENAIPGGFRADEEGP